MVLRKYLIIFPQYNGYSTGINAYEMQEARVRVQIFRRKFHIYIHLDQAKVEILSCKKKKKKKIRLGAHMWDKLGLSGSGLR